MILTILFANVAYALSASLLRSQTYQRHCRLPVEYPNGTCLRIQNQNATNCPQLDHESLTEGFVLGYCDVITFVDHDPDRVPEFIVRRKCRPECTTRCAAVGPFWCKQILENVKVETNGTTSMVQVPSDCLCVYASEDTRIIDEYREPV